MKFTVNEAVVALGAMKSTGIKGQQGQIEPRMFPLEQQTDAGRIAKEIKTKCVNDQDMLIEGEMEFSKEEIKLLVSCLSRPWPMDVLEDVANLKEKLKV